MLSVSETPLPPSHLRDAFQVRSHRRVRLGPPTQHPDSGRGGSRAGVVPMIQEVSLGREASDSGLDGQANFTLSLCNIGIDGPRPVQMLAAPRDRSHRETRMSLGYYLTGPLWSTGPHCYAGNTVFDLCGGFEPIL